MNTHLASQRGITLIEMIIVVSIIGILFALVYPNYVDKSLRAKRVDATTALLALAAEQEKFFIKNNRFANDMAELGDPTTANQLYTFTVESASDTQFLLTAVPNTADGYQSQTNDAKCTAFTIDELGRRGATGSGSNPAETCWR